MSAFSSGVAAPERFDHHTSTYISSAQSETPPQPIHFLFSTSIFLFRPNKWSLGVECPFSVQTHRRFEGATDFQIISSCLFEVRIVYRLLFFFVKIKRKIQPSG